MSYDIDRPRGKPRSSPPRRGSDVSIFANSLAALSAHGSTPHGRLDNFCFRHAGTDYSAFDLMTSYPCLSHAVSVVCSGMDEDDTIAYDPRTRELDHEILNLHRDDFVRRLREDLRTKQYRRAEPTTADLPKIKYRSDNELDVVAIWDADDRDLLKANCFDADGKIKTRRITVDSIAHRVAARAANTLALAFAAPRLKSCVIGCVPGVGMPHIIKGLRLAAQTSGRHIALCFDITGFYDNIVNDKALAYLRGILGYAPKTKLGLHLEGLILGADAPSRGLPQGNPLSPLLANVYAAEAIDVEAMNWGPYMRYVDDGLVLCRSMNEAHRAFKAISTRANGYGLTLHPDKTEIHDLRTSTMCRPVASTSTSAAT